MQSRPKALWRVLFHPDRGLRHAMRWYTQMGRRVWPYEILQLPVRDRRLKDGPTVARVLGRAAGRGGGGDDGGEGGARGEEGGVARATHSRLRIEHEVVGIIVGQRRTAKAALGRHARAGREHHDCQRESRGETPERPIVCFS